MPRESFLSINSILNGFRAKNELAYLESLKKKVADPMVMSKLSKKNEMLEVS